MTERETTRLVAWAQEMRRVHSRLREALQVVQGALDGDVAPGPGPGPASGAFGELLLFCHGFCLVLGSHHRAEDATLFPAIVAAHPGLAPVLDRLRRDHVMIGHLLAGLATAVERKSPPEDLRRHVDGVAALMENHFRYEERELLGVLEVLQLDVPTTDALGDV